MSRRFSSEVITAGLRRLGSGIDALDRETDRLRVDLRSRDQDAWTSPTRCREWLVRDVVAHLCSGEIYNQSCIEGTLDSLGRLLPYDDDEDYNRVHVARRRELTIDRVFQEWNDVQSFVRSHWSTMAPSDLLHTQIGAYPVGMQAWHIASEYATHSDDIGTQVPPSEVAPRLAWRFRFARYAILEKGIAVETLRSEDNLTSFIGHGAAVSLTEDEVVRAVSGRLDLADRAPSEQQLLTHIQVLI